MRKGRRKTKRVRWSSLDGVVEGEVCGMKGEMPEPVRYKQSVVCLCWCFHCVRRGNKDKPLSRNWENFSMAGDGEGRRDRTSCDVLGRPGRGGPKWCSVDFVSKQMGS